MAEAEVITEVTTAMLEEATVIAEDTTRDITREIKEILDRSTISSKAMMVIIDPSKAMMVTIDRITSRAWAMRVIVNTKETTGDILPKLNHASRI